ncbi:hypothetical protein BFS16_12165 [Hoylesella timonensis]|uniref:Uncharacterized protein n=1 Tax=Hoylesella timonensis TaxID=386414 RepID=A0A2K0X9L5_9BACT|nr:hypothetical protein BFS16_12165 [Hoylesella timonensis]
MTQNIFKSLWLNSSGKHFTLINVTYEQTESKPKKAKQNQRSNLMSEIAKMVTMDFNQIFGTMVFIGGHFVPNVT